MRRSLGILLLVAAFLQLGFRGMQRVRTDVPAWDFASVYAASRTWMHGGNPYDLMSVVDTWHGAGAFSKRDVSYFATVYPPSSLLTIMPFAPLPAAPAMILWMALTVGLLVVQFFALADMAQLERRDPRILILVGASLAAAPLQFGILSGQLSVPAISLCVIAFWCAGKRRDNLAGVLLGLACAVKPQVAGPFALYYLLLRRLNLVGAAFVVATALWIVAIVAMRGSHVDWIDGWRQSVAATTRVGAVNDYGWTNRFRDEIVDLKMLMVNFGHNPMLLRVAVEGTVVVLVACYVRWFPRGEDRTPRGELLALACVASLCLLPVYHRVYDVALLTTALAWALAELDGTHRRNAVALLIPMAIFLIPFDSVKSVGNRLHHLSALSQQWWWQSLVVPHYAWGLFATTIMLLIALRDTTEPKRAGKGKSEFTELGAARGPERN